MTHRKVLMVPFALMLCACAEGSADMERSWDYANDDAGSEASNDAGLDEQDDGSGDSSGGNVDDGVSGDGSGADEQGGGDDTNSGDADGTDGVVDAGAQPSQDAGADDGTDEEPVDPFPMCPATSGCNAARQLPDFKGDDSSQPTLTTTGSGSEFVSVNVLESSNAPFLDISVRFRLTMQADANYDLFVYDGCSSTPLRGGMAGATVREYNMSWSDTLIVDDTRKITIEVRHVSGQCSPWTLQVIKP